MKTEHHLENLTEIRSIMERNTRFLSLSGLSGVFAGLFALAGAATAYSWLKIDYTSDNYFSYAYTAEGEINESFLKFFFTDALCVLLASLAICYFLTARNSKKHGELLWTKTSKRLTINMLIPLFTGGIFCLLLLYHGQAGLIAPCMLIFYGLALINASKFTHDDIRTLGLLQISLGLLSVYFIGFGLLFWAIGFGLLHIVYGLMMYSKYER